MLASDDKVKQPTSLQAREFERAGSYTTSYLLYAQLQLVVHIDTVFRLKITPNSLLRICKFKNFSVGHAPRPPRFCQPYGLVSWPYLSLRLIVAGHPYIKFTATSTDHVPWSDWFKNLMLPMAL